LAHRHPRARVAVGDRIAAIVELLPRARKARPMPAFGSEFIVVGRTLAAIVVHAPDPALSIGFLEGAGTTLTL
jgi:hypothetical protein